MGITSTNPTRRLLVTGSSGRLGRLLRLLWHGPSAPSLPVIWSARTPSEAIDIAWEFTGAVPEAWPEGAVILHMAGRVSGDESGLAENVNLARAVARAARSRHAEHVILASSVAVYRPAADPISEMVPPDPQSDYGRSKRAAESVLAEGLSGSATGFTALRIANVAGADALLGGALGNGAAPVVLDPVQEGSAGPERSYVGPQSLARSLAGLVELAAARPGALPAVLNLAQPGPVAMGDLLDAAGLAWRFGTRPAPAPRVVVDTSRLQDLMPLPPATAEGLVAELAALQGLWP